MANKKSLLLITFLLNKFCDYLIFGQRINESQESCFSGQFCPELDYGPLSPYVPCIHLYVCISYCIQLLLLIQYFLLISTLRPIEFLECEEPFDHKGNETARLQMGFGCSKVLLLSFIDETVVSIKP